MRADHPVAVFDSGVGGLTVLHELLVSLPTEDYLYLGDTARFPYGDRTPQELRTFSIEIAEHLLEEGAKLLVVACNSASAAALDALVVETVRGHCAPLRAAQVDTVILGCTHYPLIAPMLQRILGPRVTLVSAGAGVTRSTERALAARGLLNPRTDEGEYRFECTA